MAKPRKQDALLIRYAILALALFIGTSISQTNRNESVSSTSSPTSSLWPSSLSPGESSSRGLASTSLPSFSTLSINTSEMATSDFITTNLSTPVPPVRPVDEIWNCTPPSIDDFPQDLWTDDQRLQGWIAVHFIASAYIFYALASICDDYFVPAIEAICQGLKLPSDVAGATFMAIATSSPELFTNIIGTFVTKGDIGVGTIVGSAVFNILAVASVCGLAAKTALPLEWYPLTRDFLFYSLSVILLIFFLGNRQVWWYEAAALVGLYLVYILVMYFNSTIKYWAERLVHACTSGGRKRSPSGRRPSLRASFVAEITGSTERTPLLKDVSFSAADENDEMSAEAMDELLIANALQSNKEEWALPWAPPDQRNWIGWVGWFLSLPVRLVLFLTIPDCRRWPKSYPLTFIMCILWIGSLSYLVSWLMTIIGYTLGIPDSVMGLTFIAAGTSVPEAVSSLIVARQGLGTMSLSNSIGSNTFDILMCLGLPWLIRSSIISSDPVEPFIRIHSGTLEYSAVMLIASLLLLYVIIALNKFYLDKKTALIALALYIVFLFLASMLEMNVFFPINLPTCPTSAPI